LLRTSAIGAVGASTLGSAQYLCLSERKENHLALADLWPAAAGRIIRNQTLDELPFNKLPKPARWRSNSIFADRWCPRPSCSAPNEPAPSTRAEVEDRTPLPQPVEMCLSSGGYFPFASRLHAWCAGIVENKGSRKYGKKPMERLRGDLLGAGAWDPCNFATVEANQPRWPIQAEAYFLTAFLTAGPMVLSRFGVVLRDLAWKTFRSGECRRGASWSGICLSVAST